MIASATALLRRLKILLTGSSFDREMDEEIRLHMDLRREKLEAAGMTPTAAHTAAAVQFGNPLVLRETSRDQWGWSWLEHLVQDARYAVRSMCRNPWFTLTAVLALAIGIGANVAIFSVVNAVLLRPLPYKDSDRLVVVLHRGSNPVSVANFVDWRDQQTAFETMAAAEYWTPNLTGIDPPEHIWALRVTSAMFPMLGVQPLLGRTFLPDEDKAGHELEVVLSYRLWQRRFAGDPNVVGATVLLDGQRYTVIGVMPRTFRFAPFWATRAELWAPSVLGSRSQNRDGNFLRVFARLKPGVTLEQARSQVSTITARLEQQYPGTNRYVTVVPLKEKVVGEVRSALLVLLGAVGFVLLIGCANVAHMLLARAAVRQREIAVRIAVGASKSRVIRQFLTESLMLALIGAVAGLALAYAGVRALVAFAPSSIPQVETVGIDTTVLLYLLAATIFTAVLFGVAPALHAYVLNLSDTLKDGGRGGTQSIAKNRLRSFLVASEFALALVLLVGAGLMIRSFLSLQRVDPGFNPRGVLSMVVSIGGSAEAAPERREIFYRELQERLRSIPGVQAASAINHLPLAGDLWDWPFRIEGRPEPKPGESPDGVYRVVMPGYFSVMDLPILSGRDVQATDTLMTPGVVLINEAAAQHYWPGESPLGKRITFDDPKKIDAPKWFTVIGVVRNAKQEEWTAPVVPEIYLAALQNRAFLQDPGSYLAYITLVVRARDGHPADLATAVKQVVWSFDRNLPISEVMTMEDAVAQANAQPRFELMLLASFAAVALLLAATGIYGVMSYIVSRRTNEIGIRMSLGASTVDVLKLIVKDGMALAIVGAASGLVLALTLARFMAKLLYGVNPRDPLTFAMVVASLLFVALAGTLIPARRAIRVDPVIALRHD